MIYDASRLDLPARLRADVCVVGSGPGGASVAMTAAEAGLRVVVLESGGLVTPVDMTQREEDMLPRLFWHAGARTTTDRAVRIHQGRCVGGTAVHNTNLCKRIPPTIRAEWRRRRGLEALPDTVWNALYDEVETRLGVQTIPPEMRSRHNQLLKAGCEALGWRGGGLSHNRSGCRQSGFCELGCVYDAKNNALKVLVPRAVRAGAEVLAHCHAIRVVHAGDEIRGVEATAVDPRSGVALGRIDIEAPRVCLSASATGTPAILRRSDVPDPGGGTGRNLHIHPALVAAGEFDAPIHAWQGIPQSYECTEWLDFEGHGGHRSWIVPAFGHPVAVAASLPGHGAAHRALMTRYGHLAVFTAMLHDHTAGEVTPRGDLDVGIDYWPDDADRDELRFGLAACARLLFAAGARRVHVPTDPPTVLERGDDPDALRTLPFERGDLDVAAVHPMSSVPMGDDPAVAAVDSRGRHHHTDGLWIADGSLFPTSIGVPPQLSIYAMGLHVGRDLAGR